MKGDFWKACLIVCMLLAASEGLKHKLSISNDTRTGFFVESFGFEVGGVAHAVFKNILVGNSKNIGAIPGKAGLIVQHSTTDSNLLLDDVEKHTQECTELEEDDNLPIKLTDSDFERSVRIPEGKDGFYDVYFLTCYQEPITFDLELSMYNEDDEGTKSYLPSGLTSLPTVYALFSATYVVVLVVWVMVFLRAKDAKVNRIHHLMTALVILKFFSVFFRAFEEHFLKVNGTAVGWNIIYYIFTGLKGIMLFTIVALIGTGWSFIKPFLSDKDKKIFIIVIPLQILDNIALIIIEETTPGVVGWFTWKDIFRLVDILCCGAILIPIVWSIKHLKEASKTDGKVIVNMHKLQVFRQFYLIVVSYIYFTRIIVYLVDATLPFRWVWLGDFFTEFSSLIFFGATGYLFRPIPDNPYFKMNSEDLPHDILDDNTVSVPLETIIDEPNPNPNPNPNSASTSKLLQDD